MQTNIEIEINILVDSKTVSSLAPMLGEVYIEGYKQVLITGHVTDLRPSNWGRDLVNCAFGNVLLLGLWRLKRVQLL